jgi:hypothetical protein
MRACDQAQNCKGDVRPTLLARADKVIEQDCCSLHLLTAASGPSVTKRSIVWNQARFQTSATSSGTSEVDPEADMAAIDYSISLRACVPRRRERGFAHQGREESYAAAMYSRASPVAYALRRRCISRIDSSATRRSSAVRMYLRMAPSVSPASSCSTSSCTR